MLAMTATRLDEPEKAVNFLLWDAKNFNFGGSGMTPRVHLDQNVAELLGNAAPESPDGPGIGARPRRISRRTDRCC